MKTIRISDTPLEASQIAFGCMEIGGSWDSSPISAETRRSAVKVIRTALDEGINFFDHADIYSRGKSEEAFSAIWQEVPHLREKIVLQSKCGIRFGGDPHPDSPGRYDFSQEHILRSVEGILRRLQTGYLDILLLHRPDALVEPEEVARAFEELHSSGKVRYFGVSNHTPAQIELLKRYLNQPLIANQVELNILHTHLIDEGVVFNQDSPLQPVRGNGTLDYCRLNRMTVQAWSPLARGLLTGTASRQDPENVHNATALVAQMAREKGVPGEAVVIAWLLRHPAGIQPIIGTTNPERIRASCQADQVELTREEWYRLFIAGRGAALP